MSAKKHENKKEVMKSKDKWEEDAVLELIYRDPESLTDGDLVSTSLSNLAKNLNPAISAAAMFNVYLRWLEVHRNNPSQLTLYWPNTVVQWVASLKARSFTKDDIVSTVEKWREKNGPFTSSKEWDEPRYPPSNIEIAKAFDGRHIGRKDRTSGSRQGRQRENSPENTIIRYRERSHDNGRGRGNRKLNNEKIQVPAKYVCNRCDKSGHFLLDCPTNMVEMPINNQRILKSVNAFQDPSFDKKPPMTYTCSLCKKSGEHWFSLCPKNTSRDSITQKRLAAGIQAAGVGALQRDDFKGYKRARPATSRESSQGRAPERALRRKITYDDDDDVMGGTEDIRFIHSDDERNDSGLVGVLRETDPYTDDFALKNRSRSLTPESPALTSPQFTLSFRDKRTSSSTTSSAEDVRTPEDDREEGFRTPSVREETPEQCYCDFVRNLIEGRTEVVNRMRRRPTALELWDEDDNRRLQAMNFLSTPQIFSPSSSLSSPLSSLESDYISDVIILDHSLDKVPSIGTIDDLDGQVLLSSLEPEEITDPMLLNGVDSPASSCYHTPLVSFPDAGDNSTSRNSNFTSAFGEEDENAVARQLHLTMENYPVLSSDTLPRGTSSIASRMVAPKTTGSNPAGKELLTPVGLMTTWSDDFPKQQEPPKKRRHSESKSTPSVAKDTTKAKRSKMVNENLKP